jgi:glycosyltransferase involved in cell wall biosynthesis
MKICVYAISKNEQQFVKRFYESVKSADQIVLADTGSTDSTVGIARELGIEVYTISVTPWRFDRARDAALALVDADVDVCISLDLDEVLMPGWREEVERVWQQDTTRLQYRYDWGQDHVFNATKVHKRTGYSWKHICHEMIFPDPRTPEVWATTEFLLIRHLPDETKSRANYLPLLEAGAKEDPYNARDAYYLARELFFNCRYEESVKEWQRYLKLPGATWYHERCFALRTMAKCYGSLGMGTEELDSAINSTKEGQNLRENWVLLAEIYQKRKEWRQSFAAATTALNIQVRDYAYTSDESVWGSRAYDAAAIAAHYLALKKSAIKYGQQALDLDPANPRLVQNMAWYSK